MSKAEKQSFLEAHLSRVLQELQASQLGVQSRQNLIRRIENHDKSKPRRLLVYVANIDQPRSALTPDDIVPIADALSAMGKVKNLDLMIHTLGGSGETAEKVVELCRKHCKGEFRVIVPNMAKSAGTLIALGADKIVMGFCSELGPIDPQIQIVVGNTPQFVSAWTFIHARDQLEKRVKDAIAKNEDPSPYLQQLAAIDPVFVTHCEQLMEFANRLGRKWIAGRLTTMKGINQEEAEQLVDKVIGFLSKVEEHVTHARLISASELKQNCVPPLDVIELPEDDPLWQLIWELYVRCEVFLKLEKPKAKLIETADVSIQSI